MRERERERERERQRKLETKRTRKNGKLIKREETLPKRQRELSD